MGPARCRETMKPMAFDDPLKSLSLADANHIHELPGLKETEGHLLAHLIFIDMIDTEFLDMIARVCACLLEMSESGLFTLLLSFGRKPS